MSVLTQNFLKKEVNSSAPPTSWPAERSALVADALRVSGRLRLQVHGESMLPAFWPGDMVEIASCSPDELRPGEIVLALRDGRLFLHRLIGPPTPSGFQLRGDSMPGPDPWFPQDALLGRLVSSAERRRKPTSIALSRALGLVFCHFELARRLALKLHNRRRTRGPESHFPESSSEVGIC
jgi:signal peptidase I